MPAFILCSSCTFTEPFAFSLSYHSHTILALFISRKKA